MVDRTLSLANSFWSGITTGFQNFIGFIPVVLGALVVLVIGWIVAGIVARIVRSILNRIHLDDRVSRTGVLANLPQTDRGPISFTEVIAGFAKWFLRLIFVQAAAIVLGMPHVTAILNSILLFIPNLLVALVILGVGAIGGRYLSSMVEISTSKLGVRSPAVFGLLTRYAVMGFATIAALNQVGIAQNLLSILFGGLVASLALAVGLAFGLGGQGVASDITRGWYEGAKDPNRFRRAG